MRIRTLREAEELHGLKVQYMRRGSGRFGWTGVINWANTRVAEVIWDTPQGGEVYQQYQLSRLYRENGEDDTGESYVMILADVKEPDPDSVSTPEEDEEFERLGKKWQKGPYEELAADYEGVAYESQGPAPESPLVEYGRNIERLGRLLQDTSIPMQELVAAANLAGFNLQFRIQPKVE